MNIYVCLFIEREDSLWHHQFSATLRKMGHTVFVPPAIGLQDSWHAFSERNWLEVDKERLTGKIIEDVKFRKKEQGVDLFFCYLFPFQFKPDLFIELSGLSIPSVYFFCDNLLNKIVASEFAPHVTLNWVPESAALGQFHSSGSKAIYLPMAANPDIYYPLDLNERVAVSFVGSKNPYRRKMLGEAVNSGLELRILGKAGFLSK